MRTQQDEGLLIVCDMGLDCEMHMHLSREITEERA
jgi:hypothetical protein